MSYAKYTGLVASGGTGVTSLNGLTGAVILAAGTGISLTPAGQTITIASTSAGDVTIGAFGSTPNANGLSINGSQVLNMQPSDATHPGGISLLAQSLGAGDKYFTNNVGVATTSLVSQIQLANDLTASDPIRSDVTGINASFNATSTNVASAVEGSYTFRTQHAPATNSSLTKYGTLVGSWIPDTNTANINRLFPFYVDGYIGGSGNTTQMIGHNNFFRHNSSGTLGTMQALQMIAQNQGVGTITTAIGALMQVTNLSTGTITSATVLDCRASSATTAGTITTYKNIRSLHGVSSSHTLGTYYGLILEKTGTGTATNEWGIYQDATFTADNFLSGRLGLNTPPVDKLTINSGTATAGGVRVVTGSTTGVTNTDGVRYGADASGNAEIRQYENLPLNFLTNNTQAMAISGAGVVNIPNLTASRAVATDGSSNLVSSATTATELGYVNGVTSAIQTQLNAKQATLTIGNLTAAGTDGIAVTSGTGSVIGAGTSIAQQKADSTHNGYLSSTDWSTFNSKGAGSVTSVAASVPSVLSISGSPITSSGTLAISYSGTALPIANGGTAVTSVTTAPTATSFAGWDANSNLSANRHIDGYRTTATASGTTTLTIADAKQQYFTGTLAQTCVMPVTATLVIGDTFLIVNNSSGAVTVQTSGANTIQAMVQDSYLILTCISTSTGLGGWRKVAYGSNGITTVALGGTGLTAGTSGGVPYFSATGTMASSALLTANQLMIGGGAGATPAVLAAGTTGTILRMGASAPAYTTATYPATTTAKQILYSDATNSVSGSSLITADTNNFFVGGSTVRNSGKVSIDFVQTAGGMGISNTDAATGSAFISFLSNTTVIGTITNSANTATLYNTTSDYRLKENIQPMKGALDRVLALKPSTYTWKSDKASGEGFIAHELQEIMPDIVTGVKDETHEDGSMKVQMVDYSKLTPLLVAAIQELKNQIDELKKGKS